MADDAAPTELAGVAELPTEWAQAWALDYDDYEPVRRFTPRRVTDAALAASLVLIAAAGVVAVLSIRGVWHIPSMPLPTPVVEPSSSAPVTTTTTTVRAQPLPPGPPGPWVTPTKPITVTVQAPARTAPPPPTVDYDGLLIANLRAGGWAVWNRPLLLQQAHWICVLLQQGESTEWVAQQLTGYPAADAAQFVTTAMLTYPSCP